jgi:hypothetical protein
MSLANANDNGEGHDERLNEPRHSGLTPFRKGDDRASIMGRRGAAAKRARRTAQHATTRAIIRELDTLRTSYNRADLGDIAAAAALDAIGRVVRGEVRLRGADMAPWVRALVDIARLEAGAPTSASVVAHVSAADVAARVGALQAQARAALAIVPARDGDRPVLDIVGDGHQTGVSLAAEGAGDRQADGAVFDRFGR